MPDRNKWMPCIYATYYGILKPIAEECGYALALHGSFSRDMDLILIPWIEDPKPVLEVLNKWADRIGEVKCCDSKLPYSSTGLKPHGRVAYTIPTGGGGYIDVSVMPTINKER